MGSLERTIGLVDQAELFSIQRKSTYVRYDNSSLSLVAHRNHSACALRVLKNGRLGSSFGESGSQEGLVEAALAAASFGQSVSFGFAKDQPQKTAGNYSAATADIQAADLMNLCEELQTRIEEAIPDASVNMVCEAEMCRRSIETSQGVSAEEATTQHTLAVEIPFRSRGTDVGAAGRLVSADPLLISDGWIQRIVEERTWGNHPSSPRTGRLPVVLTPAASNLLTVVLSSCLAGSAMSKGLSPLANRAGQQILSDKISLQEDPWRANMPFARSFDDEGIACQPRAIIETGVLKGFITDLRSAADLGQRSTGNAARRTMFTERAEDTPTPSFLGAIIQPGSISWRELASQIDEGILVTRMLGLHSSNLMQGQFAVQVNGFHIRGGEVVGYLERTMMSGNLFEDFLHVRGISSEQEPTWQGPLSVAGLAPYIVLDSVQVTVG